MKLSISYLFKSLVYFVLRMLYVLSRQKWFRPILRFLARILKRKNDVGLMVRGQMMYGNTMDRIAAMLFWKYSTLEDYETTLMKESISEGMKVLDIGANIGYHTLQISRWVGEKGQVIAFEPDPENHRLLRKNLEANRCNNVSVYQGAVSNFNGDLKLFFCEENRGDHRIYDSGDQRESFVIKSVKLDDFFNRGECFDVIKMDIQGAEPLAFEGMQGFLGRHKKLTIFCEFFPDVFVNYNYRALDFLTMIAKHGFQIYVINDHERKLDQFPPEGIVAMCRGEKYVNLLLRKS